MPNQPRAGTVRPGWNIAEGVAASVRTGSAARGIAANIYLERSLQAVSLLQELAAGKGAGAKAARDVLAQVGLEPVTV